MLSRRSCRTCTTAAGVGHQDLQRARSAGEPVQVGLRHGQARPGGVVEGARAGGRSARRHQELHESRLTRGPRWSRSRFLSGNAVWRAATCFLVNRPPVSLAGVYGHGVIRFGPGVYDAGQSGYSDQSGAVGEFW